MSVKVDLNQLADKLADYTFAYLVTVDDNYHAHTVAVEPHLVNGVIHVGPVGGHTRRNLASHEHATLVCPPRQPGGYSLIVDGRGQAGTAGDETHQIVPSRAVLHRRAAQPGPPGECDSDCIVLSEN
ncbi:pyridoxamine 5'-phosphate oxidase family protein [Mycobacterium sp. 134]|uniref:pyridoxamine 5'-phosphate oxidase family protein n=1 Tax=Mycobacterium sp. 134 TaxID=3400425 RepID=UPI003AABEA33